MLLIFLSQYAEGYFENVLSLGPCGEYYCYRVEELNIWWQHGENERENSIADTVQSRDGKFVIVVHMVAVTLGLELESLGEDLPQDGGEELVVGDVLDLGPHHLPGLLVKRLLVPVRVDGLQQRGQPVVRAV